MIVFARSTSPPSRCTWRAAGSMRVIERVTRISAPSLRACCNARIASSSPETPDENRGSSRFATTCRPGRPEHPARPRSSAVPPTRRRRLLRARQVRRPRSPCRTPRAAGSVSSPSRSAIRRCCGLTTVLPPMARIAGRSSSVGTGPPHCSATSGSSGFSHLNEIWLRWRKRRSSAHERSHWCPSTRARGGGGSAACRPQRAKAARTRAARGPRKRAPDECRLRSP